VSGLEASASDPTEHQLQANSEQLVVEVQPDAGSTVVRLRGELDLCSSPEAAAALTEVVEAGERHVVLDLRQLAFLDVSGLHVLEAVADRLSAAGGRLVLRAPTRPVRRLLDLRANWAPTDPWEIEKSDGMR
jgi:anti-anti-sigma factor